MSKTPEKRAFAEASNDAGGSADRFGYEWAHYSHVLPESRMQLERWLGSMKLASFRDKRVLDVGCGMGRNPYWMATVGARTITCIDADQRCVEVTRGNLSGFAGITVTQASVYELTPDDFGQFDRVTCIGVLMILEDPREALRRMWECVAPGGDLVLWVYAKEGNRLLLPFINAFRSVGSRLPLPAVKTMAKVLTFVAVPAARAIPIRTEYYRHLRRLSRKNVESIIFDQMIPRHAVYWSNAELKQLLSILPTQPQIELVQGNSWHVRLMKGTPVVEGVADIAVATTASSKETHISDDAVG